jgi:isopentenyl-diphosphate delta-isomerase
MCLVASGGIRNGLDVARSLALGADLAGMALPVFRAFQTGGPEAAGRVLEAAVVGLKQALVLTGTRKASDLQQQRRVVTGDLKDWLAAL